MALFLDSLSRGVSLKPGLLEMKMIPPDKAKLATLCAKMTFPSLTLET